MKRIAWVLLSLPALMTTAQAASFDCAKAQMKVETLICGNAELSKLDEKLNTTYQEAIQDEPQADFIRQEQKQWIEARNGCSDVVCVKSAYETRLSALASFDYESLAIPGNTSEEKIAFLKNLVSVYQQTEQGARIFKYFRGALYDKSVDVRSFALSYGEFSSPNFPDNKALAMLIKFMTSDHGPKVRETAALRISNLLTSNGVETCTNSKFVEIHLNEFMLGLRDDSTAQFVLEVFGMRYSGDKPLACCLSANARNRVVKTLEELERTPPLHTIAPSWTSKYPAEALHNIRQCVP